MTNEHRFLKKHTRIVLNVFSCGKFSLFSLLTKTGSPDASFHAEVRPGKQMSKTTIEFLCHGSPEDFYDMLFYTALRIFAYASLRFSSLAFTVQVEHSDHASMPVVLV